MRDAREDERDDAREDERDDARDDARDDEREDQVRRGGARKPRGALDAAGARTVGRVGAEGWKFRA